MTHANTPITGSDQFELSCFFLSSTEDSRFASGPPFRCAPLSRLRMGKNDQFLLIRISPPLRLNPYDPSSNTTDTLVITPHMQNDTLFPVSYWPLPVHIHKVLYPIKYGRPLSPKQIKITAWGDIHRATATIESRSYESILKP